MAARESAPPAPRANRLRAAHADGSPARTNDLTDIAQTLDLWNGEIISHFKFDGEPVEVETVCDPKLDAIAVRVRSPLLKQRRLAIQIHFPYGTGEPKTADWTEARRARNDFAQDKINIADISRASWTTTFTLWMRQMVFGREHDEHGEASV
jgi:hypothetical protein